MFLMPGSRARARSNALRTLVLLNTVTAANSTVLSDLKSWTTGFPAYEVVLENIIPGTNATNLVVQIHSGGTFQSTSYIATCAIATTTVAVTANPTTNIQLSQTSGMSAVVANGGFSGFFRVSAPSNTTTMKNIFGAGTHYNGANSVMCTFSGFWNGGAGIVDGFEVLFSSGSVASGIMKVYGIP